MGELVPAKFWIISMQICGIEIAYHLLYPEVTWVGRSKKRFLNQFIGDFDKHCIESGKYLEALMAMPDIELEKDEIFVEILADRKHELYPDLNLRFDIYIAPIGEHWLGFVPILGVEACADNRDALHQHLEDTIRLEFTRNKRLRSVRSIIPLLWYEQIEASPFQSDLEFYTLSELQDIINSKRKRLLPQIATKLTCYEQETFGVKEELEQLYRVGKGLFYRSVLLVGSSGVGKTALVQEFVRTKSSQGIDTDIWEVSAARLLQKLSDDLGWQQNLSTLCTELAKHGESLYVPNFYQLFEVGRYVGNETSIGEYLRDYIAKAQVIVISECSEEELAVIELRYPGVIPLFQIIRINEPPEEQLHDIVRQKAELLARKYKVMLNLNAVVESISLHRRFTPYSGFPGKPLRFLENVLIREQNNLVDHKIVVSSFCAQTGLPLFLVDPEKAMDLDQSERFFRQKIFGQERAIKVIVDLLASVKVGLTRPAKPIASLMFVGPTGVGKTEMAKVLAEFMFSSRERMLRFDMSEFADLSNVMRLTGDGQSQDGLLTSAVREQPFCVLLFDELEKAHPAFFDLLLQILGSGRLTDAKGKIADFCSTVIIMTSNIGVEAFQRGNMGFLEYTDPERDIAQHFQKTVQKAFRPELYNRIDQIVSFAALDKATVERVLERELDKVRAREGIRFREIQLLIDANTRSYLVQCGYDTRYGARHLQREIRSKLLDPLARQINTHNQRHALIADVCLGTDALTIDLKATNTSSNLAKAIRSKAANISTLPDNITHSRRIMQQIADGPIFIQLQSQLDILEQRKRQKKDDFWKDLRQAQQYSNYLDTLVMCENSFQKIDELEIEALLDLFEAKKTTSEIGANYEAWRQNFELVKLKLYSTVKPEENQCILAIYGDYSILDVVSKIYFDLIKIRNFEAEFQVIWMQEGLKPWQPLQPLQFREDRATGIIMQIKGPVAWLYFQSEIGKQMWDVGEDDKIPYIVEVQNSSFSDYHPPTDIHRKKFYDNKNARRTCHKKNFFDEVYQCSGSIKNIASELSVILERMISMQILNILIGDEYNMP